jgi:DNA-binding transcriptional MerR regulator
VFRAQEVCEIAAVQPYVLRSWEAEFPDLGVAKTPTSPRIYRRADVERVLRLKHLLFVDGLTLAGARKRLAEEGESTSADAETVADTDVAAMLDQAARQSLREIRRNLQWILSLLSGDAGEPQEFVLRAEPAMVGAAPRRAAPPVKAKVAKKGKSKRR